MTREESTDPRPRRRFLRRSGVVLAGALAGCLGGPSVSTPTTETETRSSPPTNGGTTTGTTTEETTTEETITEEPPKRTLETKYNSREKFRSPGTSFDDFEDVSRWERLQGGVSADPSRTFTGTQSLKLVGKSGRHASVRRTLSSPLDVSDRDLSVAFRSANPDVVAFFVYLYDADDNWAVLELRNVTQHPSDVGWFRTCPGVFATSDADPDLTAVERIQIEVANGSDGDAVSWVDDMRLHPRADTGYVVLSWDDGKTSYYETAAPMHDEYGLPAVLTHAPYPEEEKYPSLMSLEQLHERQDAGDEVVAHGSVGEPFAKISTTKLDGILRHNKQWLLDHGFDGADFVVYPGNSYDDTALDVVSRYHYMGGMNQSGNVNTTGVYGFDPLVLPRTIGYDLNISKRAVTLAAEHRQCTILNFHQFGNKNTMPPAEYRQLLKHIDGTAGIEAITFSDLWEMRRSGP